MSRPNPDAPLTRYRIVNEVAKIMHREVDGTFIPWSWRKHIRTPSGKMDMVAIDLLADIVYWHRPMKLKKPERWAGESVEYDYGKKFDGQLYHLKIWETAHRLGWSNGAISEALKRLVDLGLVTRQESTKFYGHVTTAIYVTPVVEALAEITYRDDRQPGIPPCLTPKSGSSNEKGSSPNEPVGSPHEPDRSPNEPTGSPAPGLTKNTEISAKSSKDFKHCIDTQVASQRCAPPTGEAEPSAPDGASEPEPPPPAPKVASLPVRKEPNLTISKEMADWEPNSISTKDLTKAQIKAKARDEAAAKERKRNAIQGRIDSLIKERKTTTWRPYGERSEDEVFRLLKEARAELAMLSETPPATPPAPVVKSSAPKRQQSVQEVPPMVVAARRAAQATQAEPAEPEGRKEQFAVTVDVAEYVNLE